MNKFKSIYTKITQVIGNFLFLFVVAFVVTAIASFGFAIANKEDLTFLGLKPIYIISGSMEDGNEATQIKKDSIIISKRVTEEGLKELKTGDIVTFSIRGIEGMPNAEVTHRLIDIDNEKNIFITKGDANEVIDNYNTDESSEGYLSTERIKYKVVMKNNWVASIIGTYREKTSVFIMYSVAVVFGWVALEIIHDQLYDKSLAFKVGKEKPTSKSKKRDKKSGKKK